ncbi:protein-export chaperone SecB [Marivita sp.]|uniref:protein-export chaperone SecB n=1 Tax=Marivita sp. TaxID=2003365 RepID=UPI0025C6D1F7|nr:protein-export chaperone SecB [Marivita sp.]
MAETPETNGNGAAQQPAQQQAPVKMNVLAQFVRDMSFENILAQKGVQGDVQPDVQLQVNLDAKKRSAENQYEVILKLQITSKAKESGNTLFVLELEYAGVFHVENVPEEQLHPFLLIECPRMLFPFVRRIVSDVTRDGGFPPLNLETIDFLQLYRTELARRASEQKSETAEA